MKRYERLSDIKLKEPIISQFIDGIIHDDMGFIYRKGINAISEAERKLEKNLNIKETAYDLYKKMQYFKDKRILYHTFTDIDEINKIIIQYDFYLHRDEILFLARKTNPKYGDLQYLWFTNTYHGIKYAVDGNHLFIHIKDGYNIESKIGLVTLLISFANYSYKNLKDNTPLQSKRIEEEILLNYIWEMG